MSELLAIPASAIALVQAVELVHNSVSKLCETKSAPDEARRVGQDLEQLRALVRQVEQYVRSNSPATAQAAAPELSRHIGLLKTDLDGFRKLLEPNLDQGSVWARNKIRLRWMVGLDKKLVHMSGRIAEHRSQLQSAFSVYEGEQSRTLLREVQQELSVVSQNVQFQRDIILSTASMGKTTIPPMATTWVRGSTRVFAELLSQSLPVLHQISKSIGSPPPSRQLGDWVLSQVHGLLHNIYAGGQVGIEVSGQIPWTPRKALDEAKHDADVCSGAQFVRRSLQPPESDRALRVMCDISHIEHFERQKSIDFSLVDYRPLPSSVPRSDAKSLKQLRLFMSDSTNTPTGSGFTVCISELFGSQYRLWKTLSTFGVHPRTSAAVWFVRSGNIGEVERMLSLGLLSPNDRDDDGHSLLWHCLWDGGSYPMCELLLQQGADPSDADKNGNHALVILVQQLFWAGKCKVAHSLRLLDLLLNYCHINDAVGILRYKGRRREYSAPAGLPHLSMPRSMSTVAAKHMTVLLRRFINCGMDLECTDKNGNTVLLHSLFYRSLPILPDIAGFLLDSGACVHAKNGYGEGCLHLLCRRLSACNWVHLPDKTNEAITELIARLIMAGLDPTEGNRHGYTPIDAAMSPAAWPLLCNALERAGRNIDEEIRRLGIKAGITSLSDTEVEASYLEAMIRETTVICIEECYDNRRGAICYLCNQASDVLPREPPFDEFKSTAVDELDYGIHIIQHHHDPGEPCDQIHEEDSCYPLDYYPADMSYDRLVARSWRRRVAAKLWRDKRSNDD